MARQPKPHKTTLGYYRCTIDGKQHHLGKIEREAWKKFHRLMAERGDTAPGHAVIVTELIESWLRLHPGNDYRDRLISLIKFAGDTKLVQVDRNLLTAYLVHLKRTTKQNGDPLATKTLVDRMATAKRVILWGNEEGLIADMPTMPKLPKPVRTARDVPAAELAETFANLPNRSGRILRFILATGCRPKEATQLQWSDVDLDRGVCIVHEHKTADKTGKPRTLFLTPDARRILDDMPQKGEGFVFTSRFGKPYTTAGLRSILRRRGDVRPYRLRHSFAQIASERVDEPVLAKLMGHKAVQTTRIYYEVRDKRATEAATSLTDLVPPDVGDRHQHPKPARRKKAKKSRTAPSQPKAKRRVS